MNNRIAVLGANEPLLPFYRQAKKLGYEIIGIAIETGAVCKELCDRFYPVSFTDIDKVTEICRNEGIEGITSFSLESALPYVTQVAERLGFVCNSSESIRLTSNKFSQREALERSQISVPQYYLIESDKDLSNIDCQFPVIVKPVDSGGSQGIYKVDDSKDLLKAYDFAKQYSRTGKVIVEEYIDGREFSVEYISHGGRHYFLQITDKITSGVPRFVEMQHHQPANISEEIKTRICTLVESALTALKIENSPSHTEIKLNDANQLFIIETGARMGGDFISSDLVRLSTGYDFVDGCIKLALGIFEEPVKTDHKYSGVYFYSKLAPEIGDIIKSHDKYPEIVEWYYSDGPLTEVKSNADRLGYFLYQRDSKSNNLSFDI